MKPMSAAYTRAEWDLLPEGFPAQLVEGALVREPSPDFGHQRIVQAVATALLERLGPGRVVSAPLDVPIDDFNVYQPDVVVLREQPPDDATDAGVPLLVVEVVSPSSRARDRTVKRVRLLDAGVAEVWLVDRHAGTIEAYDLGRYRDLPRRATGSQSLASGVVPGFVLVPDGLFAPRRPA
jgi:Uma2 family endonuclease